MMVADERVYGPGRSHSGVRMEANDGLVGGKLGLDRHGD